MPPVPSGIGHVRVSLFSKWLAGIAPAFLLFTSCSLGKQAPSKPASPPSSYTTILISVNTSKGVRLDGALFEPSATPKNVAVLITHERYGNFYNLPVQPALLAAAGYTTLAINRRDHDSHFGQSIFEDGMADLGTSIDYLDRLGYKYVFLAGHGLGALFALSYAATGYDRRVKGLGLLGLPPDPATQVRNDLADDFLYQAIFDLAKEDVARGDDTADLIVKSRLMSARTFLSYYSPATQVVSAGLIGRVLLPTLLIHDSSDTAEAPRSNQDALRAAAAGNVPPITNMELTDREKHTPAEGHVFAGMQDEVAKRITDWLSQSL